VVAPVLEFETGADHVAAHGIAHEHLIGPGQVADPFGDGHRQPCDVIAADLDFAGVYAGS
jgi:hypothetical protein